MFVNPISEKYGWTKAAIQVAFTIFVLTETWRVPIEGYLVDVFGPRLVVLVGGILCGIGCTLISYASSLTVLYIAAISGTGAGAVYGTCVGNARKWFTDRRGLAAGLTAAGFGTHVTQPDEIHPAMQKARDSGRPALVDVVINREGMQAGR